MNRFAEPMARLIEELKKLPGVGSKSAQRLAFHILRASEEDAESKLIRAGATTVICPYVFAGQRIARVLTRPHVQQFIDIAFSSPEQGGLDLQIEEVYVSEKSKLENLSLAHLRVDFGIIVLAIRRESGRLDFNPEPEQTVSAGDFVIAMGDSRKLSEFESLAGV